MTSRFFKYLYFLRFSVAGWLFLPILCALDLSKKTASITRAILTLDSGWQAYHATFFVVAIGMTVLITARNTVRNGSRRFCDYDAEDDAFYSLLTDPSDKALWLVFGIAHVPTALTLAYLAYTAKHEGETFGLPCIGDHWAYILVFFALGLLGALAFWYIVSLFYYWTYRPAAPTVADLPATSAIPSALLFPHWLFGSIGSVSPPPRLTRWIDLFTQWLLQRFSYIGYAEDRKSPLWELHFLSTVSLVGIFLVYVFLYPLTAPVIGGNRTFIAEIVACVALTALFIHSIANAGYTTSDHKHCTWAPFVKWGFIGLAVTLALVFLIMLSFDHHTESVRLEMAFPTFGSVLVLAIFFLWLFAGAAFFLDRYRIPVLTAVLLLIFLPKWAAPYAADCLVKHNHPWAAEIFDSDHFFTVTQLAEPMEPAEIPTPRDAVMARVKHPEEPYIIVTASGGGIQAAEWTAQVMAQLEKTFAADPGLQSRGYTFHDHLLLASGVSGGSDGLMPYLLEYTAKPDAAHPLATPFPVLPDNPDRTPNTELVDRITGPPGCSSLEAVGWGLSYHDLLWLLSPIRIPTIFRDPKTTVASDTWEEAALASDTRPDRSWALAEGFNRNLHDEHCNTLPNSKDKTRFDGLPKIVDGNGMTLKGAAEMLGTGRFPAFTFNTTAEETGSRFLLSNYAVPPHSEPQKGTVTEFVPAESFLQDYAVRRTLQASFKGKSPLYADLPLSTAARLSATFPIVSSGTRIPPAYVPHAYHFLDGGYFDNDGTASAIEFLKSVLYAAGEDPKTPPDTQLAAGTKDKPLKILLIEIRDDDGKGVNTNRDTTEAQDGAARWTPLTQLAGIAGGLWNAGHVSIARRNRRELCTMEEKYSDRLTIRHIVFTIPTNSDGISPLSWKLTRAQNSNIAERSHGVPQPGQEETNTELALRTAIGNVRDMLGIEADSTPPAVVYPLPCETWSEPVTLKKDSN